MTAPVFVDTNIFVYLHGDSDPAKRERADSWIDFLARRRAGRLSTQVLQELYAVLTRKVRPAMELELARSIVRDLGSWKPLSLEPAVLERAWNLESRYSLSWWDSLIVAAAQASQCGVLLTEDLQDGQQFGGVRIVDPFSAEAPDPRDALKARAR
ncbi:MAG: PIN domain-containing protein [Acidobacteriota bacterium]|nr:PIN domain-containing protein [Acidobacteriota bacterium]